jgi:hypothetical protein
LEFSQQQLKELAEMIWEDQCWWSTLVQTDEGNHPRLRLVSIWSPDYTITFSLPRTRQLR